MQRPAHMRACLKAAGTLDLPGSTVTESPAVLPPAMELGAVAKGETSDEEPAPLAVVGRRGTPEGWPPTSVLTALSALW